MSDFLTVEHVGHFGVIPDGGRRWAKMKGVPLAHSYCLSMEKLTDYARAIYEHGTEAISIYLLSKHNLKRTPDELRDVYRAEGEFIRSAARKLGASVRIAGDKSLLPPEIASLARQAERESVGGDRRLYLCLAYDPFDELCAAQRRCAPWTSRTDVINGLWVDRSLDLVIRTGGAATLSDFLPLQSAYARIVFLDDLFNDTTRDQILELIRDHETRHLLRGE